MKKIKSHLLWYTKSQRNGILILVGLILAFQFLYVFAFNSSDEIIKIETKETAIIQQKIDSLKSIQSEKGEFKIYPFNPNFISDFKGYQLGMSTDEIDRLHQFRKQEKWINSKEQFQEVTKVSDDLLNSISPYFKFPDWVTKNRSNFKKNNYPTKDKLEINKNISSNDINLATANDFKTINGIGEKLSVRIVKYRTKIQGYYFEDQLYEVWGLDKETANKVLNRFKITSPPSIKKININTANFKEVLKTPYIDYELCKKIFNYRDEVAEIQNISELKKINGFPISKFNKIILYLEAK